MNKEKVVSREYKVMLQAKRFSGNEQDLLSAANTFWHEFQQAIDNTVIKTNGDLKNIESRRTIRFYDTDKDCLRGNDYIFRERQDASTNDREVTLKFRYCDRYIAQDRNMDASTVSKGKTKFEEDIKPPFLALYSFSTTQKVSDTKKLSKMKDIIQLYPRLVDELSSSVEEDELRVVKGFTAYELVIKGASFRISKKPELDAECALIAWYENKDERENPVVVEFSFRYGDEKENYTRKMAHKAHDVFQILQTNLTSWVDPNSETKTAYVYS